jgi:hypothetical protein
MKVFMLICIIVAIISFALILYNYKYFGVTDNYIQEIKELNQHIFKSNTSIEINITSYTPLLFENIRFGQMPIKFYLDIDSAKNIPWFRDSNIENVLEAFDIWSNLTNRKISFVRTLNKSDAQIIVSWSRNLTITNTTSRTVGEGGPIEIVDTGFFNLTIKAIANILPAGIKCIDVNRALHELGHVLGFDHTDNPLDIMYPYESCSRQISQNEIRTLENLYSLEPKAQLHLYNISAFVHYGYLDLNFTVKNVGLVVSPETEVKIYSDNKNIAKVSIANLLPGSSFLGYLKNVKIIYGSKNLTIVVDPEEKIDMWYRNLTYLQLNLK